MIECDHVRTVKAGGLATISWFESIRRSGPIAFIFYRGDWCESSTQYLKLINESISKLERSDVKIFGISSQSPEDAVTLQESLQLKFVLLGCPGNALALYLNEKGFVDVYAPPLEKLSNVTTNKIHCIQPGVLITGRSRILFSWAVEERTEVFGFLSEKSDEWPSVDTIMESIKDELADDNPHKLTPVTQKARKRSFWYYLGFSSTRPPVPTAAAGAPVNLEGTSPVTSDKVGVQTESNQSSCALS
jgi:hypothetical protein